MTGRQPTDAQKALYLAYPQGSHGYSHPELDSNLFLAVFILALWLSHDNDSVRLLVPPVAVGWTIKRMKLFVRAIARRYKNQSESLESLKAAVQRLSLGSRILQLQGEPACWVAFGFNVDTPAPGWLLDKLLKL
jgi:hypothetical protein